MRKHTSAQVGTSHSVAFSSRRPRSDTRREQFSLDADQLALAPNSCPDSLVPEQVLMLKHLPASQYEHRLTVPHTEENTLWVIIVFISLPYALFLKERGQCGFMGL